MDEVVFPQAETHRHELFLRTVEKSKAKQRYKASAQLRDHLELLTAAFPETSTTELERLRRHIIASCVHARNYAVEQVIAKGTPNKLGETRLRIRAARDSAAVVLGFFEQPNTVVAANAAETARVACSRLKEAGVPISGGQGKWSASEYIQTVMSAVSFALKHVAGRADMPSHTRKYLLHGCLRYPASAKRRRHYPDAATMLMMDLLNRFGDPLAQRHFDLALAFTKQTFYGAKVDLRATMRQRVFKLIKRNPKLRVAGWLQDD